MRFPRLNRMRARDVAAILALAVFAVIAACQPDKRITKANVEEVADGMAKKQVESILGLPSTVDVRELDGGMKETTFLYTQGSDRVKIVFRDDKVISKETTLAR